MLKIYVGGYFTESQIKAKLDELYEAQTTVVVHGQSYTVNDGQGNITVTRANPSVLENLIKIWEGRLAEVTDNSGPFVSLQVRRRGTY